MGLHPWLFKLNHFVVGSPELIQRGSNLNVRIASSNEIARYVVFDLSGNVVQSPHRLENNSFNVSDFDQGIYFLKVIVGQKEYIEKHIIEKRLNKRLCFYLKSITILANALSLMWSLQYLLIYSFIHSFIHSFCNISSPIALFNLIYSTSIFFCLNLTLK